MYHEISYYLAGDNKHAIRGKITDVSLYTQGHFPIYLVTEGIEVIVVGTNCDKSNVLTHVTPPHVRAVLGNIKHVYVSSLTGFGVSQVWATILRNSAIYTETVKLTTPVSISTQMSVTLSINVYISSLLYKQSYINPKLKLENVHFIFLSFAGTKKAQ